MANNIRKPPKVFEKTLGDMTDKEKCCYVVDGLKRRQTFMQSSNGDKEAILTLNSRFNGMTKAQIENWAKTTIGIHVRQWKIKRETKKEV